MTLQDALENGEEPLGLTASEVLARTLQGTDAGPAFPLWVVNRYAARHDSPPSLRDDMEQTAILATVRALKTYDPAKGTLVSWLRRLIEQDLSKLLRPERRRPADW